MTKIKVCGITQENNARMAIDLGVHALGFVFYAKSKRAVSPEMLKWIKRLPSLTQTVALFVNPSKKLVDEILSALPINVIQFHGNESVDFCEQFTPRYIKAIPMQKLDLTGAKQYMKHHPNASAFLLDNYGVGEIGGSGTHFDWNQVPKNTGVPLIMAGGLNASNVGVVINQCQPYGVDVSSGVETNQPGIKSSEKIAAFVEAVKIADNN